MIFSRVARRGSFALITLATLLLAACGGDDDDDTEGAACSKGGATGDTQETITVGAASRSYFLHVPAAAASKSVALVFAFHGDGGNGKGFSDSIEFQAQSKDDAIVVYPDATKSQGGDKSFDDLTEGEGNQDVALFDAILAKLQDTYCITRTFAFGHSRGAYFTNHLACYRGSKLAGISAHSGGGPHAAPYQGGVLQCPDKPTASMVIHGLADTDVAPSEGKKSLDQWSRTLSCAATTKAVDPSPCVAYDACTKPLESCQIPGLGHAVWDKAVETTWNFFKAQ